jgi:hypothetical protein
MSRQENAPDKPLGMASSTTPSRLARTNPNQIQRLLNHPSPPHPQFPAEDQANKVNLMPTKVSDLDKNIIFQDMDKNKTSNYQSTNSSRINSASTPNSMDSNQSIGLISNVFLGATNRFVKGVVNNANTPVKVAEEIQPEVQDTNKNTPAKFSRNKDVEPKNRTVSMKEPPPESGQATDRSAVEGTKKIERRQAGNRELKFA